VEQPDETTLFVAATRPAMVMGLPIGLFVIFLMAIALIMILVQNPLYEFVLVPAWFGARFLLRYDYNAVRVAGLWMQTKARSFDAAHLGGASPAPFPIRQSSEHPRGIAKI
jgi:type IV secretion system protein VirB3